LCELIIFELSRNLSYSTWRYIRAFEISCFFLRATDGIEFTKRDLLLTWGRRGLRKWPISGFPSWKSLSKLLTTIHHNHRGQRLRDPTVILSPRCYSSILLLLPDGPLQPVNSLGQLKYLVPRDFCRASWTGLDNIAKFSRRLLLIKNTR
jgi:hypothetical protein